MDSTRITQKNSSPSLRYLGVRRRSSGRYGAQIIDLSTKRQRWLGTFDTAEEAALAYDRSARFMRGLKARTNFIYSDMPLGSSVTSIISPDDHQNHQINAFFAPPVLILDSNFHSSSFPNFGGKEEWSQNVQVTPATPPPSLVDLIFDDGAQNVQMMMPSDDITISDITISNGVSNETQFLGNQFGQNINRISSVSDTFSDGVEEERVKYMKAFDLNIKWVNSVVES